MTQEGLIKRFLPSLGKPCIRLPLDSSLGWSLLPFPMSVGWGCREGRWEDLKGHSAHQARRGEGLGADSPRARTLQPPPPACPHSDTVPAAISSPAGPARNWQRRAEQRGESSPPPSFCFFLAVLFFAFGGFFYIQPRCGPIQGLLPPSTSSLVAVTRQTFLVVTAGLVELSSSTGMFFKKRASQTTVTLNSNAAGGEAGKRMQTGAPRPHVPHPHVRLGFHTQRQWKKEGPSRDDLRAHGSHLCI